jgi:GNAT superfamily N-acetyltransferase
MLTISWTSSPTHASALAEFFVRYLSPDYISHGELQLGRALDPERWSPNLTELLTKEFESGAESQPTLDGVGRSAMAHLGDELVAGAVVSFHDCAYGAYAVFEDLVVAPEHRRRGVGAEVTHWLEEQALRLGCSRVFLESGLHNEGAHSFFHQLGFKTCSITMMKTLAS